MSGQRDALARGTAATCSYANKVTIYNCRISSHFGYCVSFDWHGTDDSFGLYEWCRWNYRLMLAISWNLTYDCSEVSVYQIR